MDATAKKLCTAALCLVLPAARYRAPVCYRSAHTRCIDSVLNDALRIVAGPLRLAQTEYLYIFSGI